MFCKGAIYVHANNFKEALTEILKNKDKLKHIEFKKVEQIIQNDSKKDTCDCRFIRDSEDKC